LSELAHVGDFWNFDQDAGTRLLTAFYATSKVDTSRYSHHVISFNTVTFPAMAKYLLALMLSLVVMAAAVLAWAALRVRSRGTAGRKTSLAMRSVLALVVGLGGWFAGALTVLTFWTTVPLSSEPLGIVSAGVPVALVLYLAWTRRDAGGGALIGGWYGYTVMPGFIGLFATITGAIAAGNIALVTLSLSGAASPRESVA
jgi:hypothetical protein